MKPLTRPHVIIAAISLLFAAATSLFADDAAPKPALMPQPLVPGGKVMVLWPAGLPTLKNIDQAEALTYAAGKKDRVQRVTNVNNPSIELHLAPADKANGTAIIVAPGGGNTALVAGSEGSDVADWLNSLGVSAFILRYRLQPYSSSVDALADTQRAIRMVRANAKEWAVDPAKIGIMGFSAGGEQAARAALKFDADDPNAADAIDKESDRPDFAVLIYPGWRELDLSTVPPNAPPVFLTTAGLDDASHARATVDFYNAFFNAKIPVEMHIYGHGGHGGGITRRKGIPFGTWPDRFADWAADLGMLKKP